MSRMDFSRRAEIVEEMDRPDCDQGILYASLRRFELTNLLVTRYRTVLTRHVLSDMRREPERTYRFTDLGAGGCDTARWLVRVCRRENLRIAVRALERDPRTVRYARTANAGYPEIDVVEGDACDSSCWGSPDYVFAQHFLHHLPDEACVRLFRTIDDAAPRRFVINDLSRSRFAYFAFRFTARLFSVGTFIFEDGCVSIRRGFKEVEIRNMLSLAKVAHPVTVSRILPARIVIVGGTVAT